jgi:hypothetical protein
VYHVLGEADCIASQTATDDEVSNYDYDLRVIIYRPQKMFRYLG